MKQSGKYFLLVSLFTFIWVSLLIFGGSAISLGIIGIQQGWVFNDIALCFFFGICLMAVFFFTKSMVIYTWKNIK